MPRYRFKALDKQGKPTEGASTAANVSELSSILKSQGLFLMESREEKSEEAVLAPPGAASLADAPRTAAEAPRHARSEDTVPMEDATLFTTQLAIMVRTAMPILESLQVLARQQPNPVFRSVIQEISRSVQHGQTLSLAFSRYPRIFDQVFVSLLAAGEAGGNMDKMLLRISEYLQFQRGIKTKVRAALLYPCIVVAAGLSVVLFLMLFILPTFVEVFGQFDIKLPIPTRVLMVLSDHLRTWWLAYLAGTALAWAYFRRWLRDPAHVRAVHAFQLRLPVAGLLVRNIVLTRILRTLSSLVSSGVPILRSLDLARDSAGNIVFQELLGRVYRSANEGKGLASALKGHPHFPESVADMIANAEKSGTLPEVLENVADYYESETDTAIKNLFSVIEPIFVVFLGLMVGGIAIAILLPIFELSTGFQ
ncbi:MAG: type II secretion system F family protein [Elusimicrobiota bacterium]